MIITLSLLQNLYNEFNAKYYENSLEPCPIIIHQRMTRGIMAYFQTGGTRWSRKGAKTISKSIVVNVNNPAFKDMNDLKEVMIHEMMHQYMRERFKIGGHTPMFKVRLRSILQREFPNARLFTLTTIDFEMVFAPLGTATCSPVWKYAMIPLVIL